MALLMLRNRINLSHSQSLPGVNYSLNTLWWIITYCRRHAAYSLLRLLYDVNYDTIYYRVATCKCDLDLSHTSWATRGICVAILEVDGENVLFLSTAVSGFTTLFIKSKRIVDEFLYVLPTLELV